MLLKVKKIILILLSAITGSSLFVGIIVLHNEERKDREQMQEYGLLYSPHYSANTNNAIPMPSYAPANAVTANTDHNSLDITLSDETSSKLFNPASSQLSGKATGTYNQTTSMNYTQNVMSSKKKQTNNTMAGGQTPFMASFNNGSNRSSETSGAQQFGFMALHNSNKMANMYADNTDVQAGASPNADPGNAVGNLTALPVPTGFYILLLASLIYAAGIFIRNRKKQNIN